MNVLVDTSVWSLALRRNKKNLNNLEIVRQLEEFIEECRVKIIGPIRQELLSGISSIPAHTKLQQYLRAFEDFPIDTRDYERAAEMFNLCRTLGIQGSHTDFLICSVAERHHFSIFTFDKDFIEYSKCLPITLIH